jgi:formylglycine-generating enzyme required for sulfatase activity
VGVLTIVLVLGGIWIGNTWIGSSGRQTPPSTVPLGSATPTENVTQNPAPTVTREPTATPAPPEVATPAAMHMAYVPEGAFWMGSAEAEVADALALCSQKQSDCQREDFADEEPQHQVILDAYWIDQTEVTNAQYTQCVDAGLCTRPSRFDSYTRDSYYDDPAFADYPVIYVSWHQAKAYCEWVGKRLPTEAEWEKAARGTDRRIFPWGNAFDGSRLSFCDLNCSLGWQDPTWDDGYADTAPVGSYPSGASPYGVLDMAGNVWEWVADRYDPD